MFSTTSASRPASFPAPFFQGEHAKCTKIRSQPYYKTALVHWYKKLLDDPQERQILFPVVLFRVCPIHPWFLRELCVLCGEKPGFSDISKLYF